MVLTEIHLPEALNERPDDSRLGIGGSGPHGGPLGAMAAVGAAGGGTAGPDGVRGAVK